MNLVSFFVNVDLPLSGGFEEEEEEELFFLHIGGDEEQSWWRIEGKAEEGIETEKLAKMLRFKKRKTDAMQRMKTRAGMILFFAIFILRF